MKNTTQNTLFSVLFFGLTLTSFPNVQASSVFDPVEIEAAIIEYYDFYNSPPSGLNETDLTEMAGALAEMIGILKPTAFNDVMGHLVSDYGNHSENRDAIQLLMSLTHDQIANELKMDKENPVLTVVDDVFKVWSVAYAFGFGKGIWISRGSGLAGIEKFKFIVQNISREFVRVNKSAVWITAAGGAIGVTHAVYGYLATKKLDPRALLENAQGGILMDIATRMAKYRDELRAIRLEKDPKNDHQKRFAEIQKEVTEATQSLQYLYNQTPYLRGKMEPIAQDIQEIQELLTGLNFEMEMR